jgi:hypothetical protein
VSELVQSLPEHYREAVSSRNSTASRSDRSPTAWACRCPVRSRGFSAPVCSSGVRWRSVAGSSSTPRSTSRYERKPERTVSRACGE